MEFGICLYEELFRILAARKLERVQNLDEAGVVSLQKKRLPINPSILKNQEKP